MSECDTIHPDESVSCVLIGFDIDFNYKKLAKAFTYLRDPTTLFIATNSDLTYPCNGTVFPGTGALVSTLSSSSGRQPVIVGKPMQTMMDVIIQKYGLDRSRTCMVGDRLDTDIQFGIDGKCGTLCVMSGITQPLDLNGDIKPRFVIDSLGSIAKLSKP